MKNLIVVIVLAVVVLGGILLIRPKVQEVSGLYGQIERYVSQAERLQGLLEVNTKELNRITSEWDQAQKEIEGYNQTVSEQQAIIDSLKFEIRESDYEIPDIPETTPEDIEDCLQELQRSRQTSTELIEVVEAQREQAAVRMATIQSQGIVIESQAKIIERQSDYIDEFETLIEEHRKKSNRRILLGIATGIAVGLFI